MAYAYWKAGRHNDHAVFDLFFRKSPFKGEYTVFAGVEEVRVLARIRVSPPLPRWQHDRTKARRCRSCDLFKTSSSPASR